MVINMGCPTREEYKEALDRLSYLGNAVAMEKKNREDLIDKLCKSQNYIKDYEALISQNREIIQKYDIYQEILAEQKQ